MHPPVNQSTNYLNSLSLPPHRLVHHEAIDDALHLQWCPPLYQVSVISFAADPSIAAIGCHGHGSLLHFIKWMVAFDGHQHCRLVPAHSAGAVFFGHGETNAKDIFYRAVSNASVLHQWQTRYYFLPYLPPAQEH